VAGRGLRRLEQGARRRAATGLINLPGYAMQIAIWIIIILIIAALLKYLLGDAGKK
jgi:hypothetical protein